MRIPQIRKISLLFVLVLFLCSILTACGPELKETKVEGFGSNITMKLPGELKKDSMQVPIDPTMKQFMKGQQLYQVEDNSLSVLIYTIGIDTQGYAGISGKDLAVSMQGPVNTFTKSFLSSMKAKNAKIDKKTITVSGKEGIENTITFEAEDKKMALQVIAFQDDDAYWIILPIYQSDDKDAVKAADEMVKSIKINK